MATGDSGKELARVKVSDWAQEESERTMARSQAIGISAQIPGPGDHLNFLGSRTAVSTQRYLVAQACAKPLLLKLSCCPPHADVWRYGKVTAFLSSFMQILWRNQTRQPPDQVASSIEPLPTMHLT